MAAPGQIQTGSSPPPNPAQTHDNLRAISRISIDELFGRYDYELPPKGVEGLDLSRLFIMYGENGTGKTTLLKLLYHALSPEDSQGHRTFLAQSRFKRLSIEFYDGTVFEASRTAHQSRGCLNLALHRESRTIAAVDIEANEDWSIPTQPNMKEPERYDTFIHHLADLKIRVHYLSDDRKHQGDLPKKRSKADPSRFLVTSDLTQRFLVRPSDIWGATEEEEGDSSVQKVMTRVVRWVQQQARKGSAEGQENVYSIFSKMVRDITNSASVEGSKFDTEGFVKVLRHLEDQSALYARYGLTVKVPANELIEAIRVAPPSTHAILSNVIKPHIDGIQAKLKALEDLYEIIDRFIETINSFYRDKQVSFSVDHGFTIRSGGEQLEPTLLSSGEGQLFVLLCNTILARRHATLFLIDEPELSLNVKWQRKLVRALLDNTKGSNVQFIMATHSMELISQHNDNVVTLKSVPHRKEEAHGESAKE